MELAQDLPSQIRQQLEDKFRGMMKALFNEKGSQLRIDILAEQPAQDFINTHADALNSSFRQVKMSDTMRQRLQRSNYIFSGIKTFHELNEAFPSLIDENGDRKPFEQFLNDVQKIDRTYNRNYLRAEYNFCHASATMAAKWEQFEEDEDRYNLQYRTANDDKVRPEHAALDRVTLPMSDPFWQEYYPPNGWNCRCTVVQVRKTKYPETPHEEAMARGEEATGKDAKGIFHFNPGIEKKTVPDYNPYTIKRCRDCDIAKEKLELAFVPDNEVCAACKLVHKCYTDRMDLPEQKRIEENRKLYEKLSKDKDYTDVEFNPQNGGLKAVHIGHNFAKVGGKYEKEVMNIGYNNGHKVILGDERGNDSKHIEGTWDDQPMEVSGKNGKSTNNIKKGLIHCAEKPECKVAIILIYEDEFDETLFPAALVRYAGLENAEGSWVAFDEVICMQDGKIVYQKSHPFE